MNYYEKTLSTIFYYFCINFFTLYLFILPCPTEPFLYMYCIHAPQTQNFLHCTVSITQNCLTIKIVLKDTTLEWEPTCLICLRLSSRHCKSLLPHHQPSQHLSIGRCLTYCICIDGRPDCHVMEEAQSNSHSLEPP